MTSYAGIKKGGESGEAGFVPGKPEESELLSQVLPSGDAAAGDAEGGPAPQARSGGSDSPLDSRRRRR